MYVSGYIRFFLIDMISIIMLVWHDEGNAD